MNGSGIGSLMAGFQQGFGFADDIARKRKHDEREDQRFEWEKKDRAKKDKYDSDAQALQDKYFPRTTDGAAQPAGAPQLTGDDDGNALPGAAAANTPTQPVPAPQVDARPDPAAPAGSFVARQTAPSGPPPGMGPGIVPEQGAGAANPAAQLGTLPPPKPAPKPVADNPLRNTNKLLQFSIERAMLDVQHGKMDGAGMLNLVKLADGMKREKMDQAIQLLHQGRNAEAVDAFDSTGDHSGFQVVDAKDSTYKVGKTEVPTKIVTVRDAAGNERIINTAQALAQQQEISKIIAQAQTDRQITQHDEQQAELVRHNKATESNAAGLLAVHQGTLGVAREKLAIEKKAAEGLTMEKVDKAGANMLKHFESVYSPKDGMTPEEKNALGAKAKSLAASSMAAYKTSWALGNKISELDAMQAVQLAQDPKNLVQRAHSDGNTYPGVLVNGTFVPVGGALQAKPSAPTPAAAPAPVQPAAQPAPAPYQPPPTSRAGQMVAQRQAAIQAQQQKVAAVQQTFAQDAQTLSPQDLLRKYPDAASRSLLAPEQKVLLQQAARKL